MIKRKTNFVAKNKNGETILYYNRPNRKESYWLSQDGKRYNISSEMFPDLKWEDEPLEVSFIPETQMNYKLSYIAPWINENEYVEKHFSTYDNIINEATRLKKLGAKNIRIFRFIEERLDF